MQTNSATGNGESKGCPDAYTPYASQYDDVADNTSTSYYDAKDTGCGDAYVSGWYSSSLTIASDTDIVINGNLCAANSNPGASCPTTPTGGALLGLIPNNFVRVYHPMDRQSPSAPNSCNAATGHGNAQDQTGTMTNPVFDAAILAVNDSFIVDNYDCGSNLQTLNVYGAIAQRFRGTVGTSGGTGYTKNYVYNPNLRYTEPPDFLAPSATVWTFSRSTLCTPSGTTSSVTNTGTQVCPSF